jgi:hypothetical protein
MIAYVVSSVFLLVLLQVFVLFRVEKLRNQITEVRANHEKMKTEFVEVNKNFAIVEQLLTPFLEWVSAVQKQQSSAVSDAINHADKIQNAKMRARKLPDE